MQLLRPFSELWQSFSKDFPICELKTTLFASLSTKATCRLILANFQMGERSFLAMITDLSRRLVLANPRMQNPLEGEGVVLIDELELHLHPNGNERWWANSSIAFPEIQFICTTHSPFIIQSLRAGELITLDPDEFPAEYSDKSIEDITEDVMQVEMPQKSARYQAMMKAAEEYFRLLRTVENGSEEALLEAESISTS